MKYPLVMLETIKLTALVHVSLIRHSVSALLFVLMLQSNCRSCHHWSMSLSPAAKCCDNLSWKECPSDSDQYLYQLCICSWLEWTDTSSATLKERLVSRLFSLVLVELTQHSSEGLCVLVFFFCSTKRLNFSFGIYWDNAPSQASLFCSDQHWFRITHWL